MNAKELYKDWAEQFSATNPPRMRDAFAAGMEAARPRWHDLEANPHDLPPRIDGRRSEEVIVCVKSSDGAQRYLTDYYMHNISEWRNIVSPMIDDREKAAAWCELPKFVKGGEE